MSMIRYFFEKSEEDNSYLFKNLAITQTEEQYMNHQEKYDVPLQNAYFNRYYDKMVKLIRSVFSSVLKTNTQIAFAVLTGCLRISKESIFTGLNNLDVYSVTEKKFSDI